MKNKTKETSSRRWVVLGLAVLILTGLFLFLPYSIPTGGAEDTNGDGKLDKFWDGTKMTTNFEMIFGR